MTVYMRGSSEAARDDITPTIPLLAKLYRQSAGSGGLVVDRATYLGAEEEMLMLRKARGYSDLPRASMARRNFLLLGVPIVCEDD